MHVQKHSGASSIHDTIVSSGGLCYGGKTFSNKWISASVEDLQGGGSFHIVMNPEPVLSHPS